MLNTGWHLRGSVGARTRLSTPLPSDHLHFLSWVGLSIPGPQGRKASQADMPDSPRARRPRPLQDGDGEGKKEGFLLPPLSPCPEATVRSGQRRSGPRPREGPWPGFEARTVEALVPAKQRPELGGPGPARTLLALLSFAFHPVMTDRVARWGRAWIWGRLFDQIGRLQQTR